jgi:hypothetical protein
MRLLQLEFGRILAGNHALVGIDVIGHAVEKSCLSRARPTRNQDIAAHPSDDFQNLAAFRRDGAGTDQLIQGQLVLSEFANSENGPVNRKRRGDDVDARAVGKTCVADWRSVVDPAPHLTDDTGRRS